METFRIFRRTPLFAKPDPFSDSLGDVEVNTAFKGEARDDGFIKTTIPKISPTEGFVLMAGAAERILTAPEPVHPSDVDAFCALVTRAARDASADRDYLLAVAYALTKNLTEFGDVSGARVGPFQLSEAEWNAAITTGPAQGLHLQPQDRFRWFSQPLVAARLAAKQVEKFQATFHRLPKFRELFFVHLVGEPAFAALADTTRKCSNAIPATETGSYADGLKKSDRTVEQALVELQTRLKDGYVEALKVIDRQPPEIRFFRANEDDPPWMAVAREQMSGGVSEDASLRNTAQIDAYFTTVGAVPGATTPWCGAFVGYCVKQCGVHAVAVTVKPNAVSTTFWETWGDKAKKPFPVGSVVVLKPQNSGGHVGFLAEGSTDDVICLLGGNQGGGGSGPDRVGIVRFPVATNPIVAVRLMTVAASANVAVTAAGAAGAAAGGAAEIAWGAKVSAAFKQKVIQISSTLGCNPDHLMAAMAFETGEKFTPDVRNPVSGATGLIQFMPPTAVGLGTTVEALAAMTAVDQLDFVLKHFLPQKGKVRTVSDLYMAILLPTAVGKPDNTALFTSPTKAYVQNAGLDKNGDGIITKEEAASLVMAKLHRGLGSGFKG